MTRDMPKPTVGQVGLGQMGGSLAKHLIDSDFDVIGFDISEEACADLADYGGEIADSNADLATSADIVLVALKNPDIIDAAFFSDDGIIHGSFDELVVIEQSTVPPAAVKALQERLESTDIDLCDCPFLGGPIHCRSGTLVSPFGGERSTYDDPAVQSVLEAISKTYDYVGDVGNGKATKLVNNTISLGNTALAMEAMALGVGHGLDPKQLFELLQFGGATSLMFRIHTPNVLQRNFEPQFPLGYTQKDLRYALRSAEELDYPMNITSAILQQYNAAASRGYAEEDTPAIVKYFEEFVDGEVATDEEIDTPEQDPLFTATN